MDPSLVQAGAILGAPAFKRTFNDSVSAPGATVTWLDDLVNPDAEDDDAVDPGPPAKRPAAATVALDATGTQ